jgi:large subunit ribosomal protein L6
MSRIGKQPILLEKGVQVTVSADNVVTVKGAKASQTVAMLPVIIAKVEGDQLVLTRKDETKQTRSLHGVYRSLLQNAVMGVTKGWTRSLDLVGVGYRANTKGRQLEMTLGFSHPILFDIPDGIDIKVEKQTNVTVVGVNKELVGQVAAKIRGFRPPEPYLGKGVKYSDEVIRRKAGKAAGK